MSTTIAVQMTPQGILVPRSAVSKWLEQDIEAIQDGDRIIIQPKSDEAERRRVIQILDEAGLLVKPDWEAAAPPVSDAELAELAKKFSAGRPLSEIAIEERTDAPMIV